MPNFSAGLIDLNTDDSCSDSGGLLVVFAAQNSDVDWTTMAGALYYDDANFQVIDWAMEASGNFYEYNFYRKNGRLDATYTREDGYYSVDLLNLIFRGHSTTRTLGLGRTKNSCGVIMQVHDNNSLARVAGKEYSGAWIDPLESMALSRHLDTHGGYGDIEDRARDEADFAGEHNDPLPYSTVSITAMQAL